MYEIVAASLHASRAWLGYLLMLAVLDLPRAKSHTTFPSIICSYDNIALPS